MSSKGIITGLAVLLGTMTAVPAFADDGQRARPRSDRGGGRSDSRPVDRGGPRAVPRSPYTARSYDQRQYDVRRYDNRRSEPRPPYGAGSYQRTPQYDVRRYDDRRRAVPRAPYFGRSYERPRQYRPYSYDYRPRTYVRPYSYPNRGYYYRPRGYYSPRLIRPYVATVLPYRPYYYRPSLAFGVYYGFDGDYPYGYVPRGYYDPIPGRIYGGVRITDAPRDAQVFADGYYAGIVDDFDGVFQHMNLEAGEHRIEIHHPSFGPIAFDVVVQPGRTITLRADTY